MLSCGHVWSISWIFAPSLLRWLLRKKLCSIGRIGTITSRRRKDGSIGYTAQIRIHRDGKCIHSESETFDRRQLATEWTRRREAELDQQRARGEPLGKGSTLTELLEWYGKEVRALTPWGRSKEADLKRLAGYPIAEKNVLCLATADYITHVETRRHEGAGPATANNDLISLRQVLRSARASLGVPIELQFLEDAAHELRQRRVIGKPKERQRRLSAAEEQILLGHFSVRDPRAEIPMADIIQFALLSARRQEEITRIQWKDLDREKGIAWLDDVNIRVARSVTERPSACYRTRGPSSTGNPVCRLKGQMASQWKILAHFPSTQSRLVPASLGPAMCENCRICTFMISDTKRRWTG